MHRRNTGSRCTVVSYGHRWNNITIQLGNAPEIAYRDAAAYPHKASAPYMPKQRHVEDKTYATMAVLPPGPTPTTVQDSASSWSAPGDP
jgi:hypothetical protein